MDETSQELSNVVRFEIPNYVDVEGLCEQIRPRWPGSEKRTGGVWVVSARLRKSHRDLARLLRTVEAYVAEAGLQAIRYHLDGRFYILEAPALDLTQAA